MFSKTWTQPSTAVSSDPIEQLKGALASADAVVVGAGAVVDAVLFSHIERFAFVLVAACAQQQRAQQEYQFSHNKHHGFGF